MHDHSHLSFNCSKISLDGLGLADKPGIFLFVAGNALLKFSDNMANFVRLKRETPHNQQACYEFNCVPLLLSDSKVILDIVISKDLIRYRPRQLQNEDTEHLATAPSLWQLDGTKLTLTLHNNDKGNKGLLNLTL